MTSEEHIRALSVRLSAAPENSEEFRIAMDELRAALKASAARGREKIAALQNAPSSPSRIEAPAQLALSFPGMKSAPHFGQRI
jgi:hypothetical protein